MKRKFLNGILAAAIVAAGSMASSCKDYNEDAMNELRADNLALLAQLENEMAELAKKVHDMQDGSTPYVGANGNWWIDGVDTGKPAVGKDGAPGSVITIGSNGNWFIDGVDTGKPAVGQNGQNGQNGKDGHSPEPRKVGDVWYWFVYNDATGQYENSWIPCQGDKGDKGDQGDKGDKGDQGDKGDKGEDGQNGQNGQDGHSPYIGTNGNWYWYNDATHQYEDTGIAAEGKDGQDGKTPYIGANGNWWIGYTDTGVKASGTNGQDGQDGKTPYIGVNGNWWIGYTDTGVPAKGQDGTNGTNGQDGLTPYIGANGNWWIGYDDTGVPAQGQNGQDGKTPYIGSNGNWWIGYDDTGVPAQGQDGTNGTNGQNGLTPYIGSNGNWWIGYTDTGVAAAGQNGTNGTNGLDGKTPYIGSNGNWWIGYDDTGVAAAGVNGTNGQDGKTPYIGSNGNWWIGYTDTGIQAKGVNGFSAYEIAVQHGFTGTEAEWLESLKGQNGNDAPVIVSIVMSSDGSKFLFTFDDGSVIAVDVDTSWKCDEEACKNAINVCKVITEKLGIGSGILSDAQLQDLGDAIQQVLDDIEKALQRTEALKARATSISVDGVMNNVFGMVKTPMGVQTNMLYGYYGKINPADAFDFPSTDPSVYADATEILDDSNVSIITENTGKGNIFLKKLGKVYYTVNPAEVDFNGVDIALASSTGKGCGISLSNAASMTDDLKMGWTRGASNYGIYESEATVETFNDVEKIDVDPNMYLDIAKDIKNKDRQATTTDILSAVKSTLDAFQTKAYALEISSSDYITGEDGKNHVIKSPLDIQAALIRPVGYEVTAQLPTNIPGHDRAISFVNSTIKTLVNQLTKNGMITEAKAMLEQFHGTLKHIQFGHAAGDEALITVTMTVTLDADYMVPANGIVTGPSGNFDIIGWNSAHTQATGTLTYSMYKSDFQKLFDVLNEDVDDINDMLDRASDVVEFGLDIINKLQNGNLSSKISTPITQIIDKLWKALDSAYQYGEYRFELCLFAEAEGKVLPMRRSFTTAPEVPSTFDCIMTNLNLEMLTPAYKKHLVCTDCLGASDKAAALAAVNASINKVYSGDTKKVTVSGLQSGVTYEFSYSGLDYAGKQLTRKLYVKCK